MDRRIATRLLQEIRENVRRHASNTAGLKWLLLELGDETYHAYPDWDWRWPSSLNIQTTRCECFNGPHWRRALSSLVVDRVSALYELFLDQPPDMEHWADEWNGNANLFHTFLFEKLDRRSADVQARSSEIERLIREQR